MTRWHWLGILLIVLGLAVLLVAPQAQSCVMDFDSTACETGGTIILKVVGLALVATAAIVLALRGSPTEERPPRQSGRSGRSRRNTSP
ncbi:MAG: hypothetical protein WEB29_11020 [Chloroflexota bacterium]